MKTSTKTYLASCLIFGLAVSIGLAAGEAPFDPAKGLKDYAGKTIIGSKLDPIGWEDSVIAGEHVEKCTELLLRNCTGMQVQVYPSFQGS